MEAARQPDGGRWIPAAGALGAGAATLLRVWRLAHRDPLVLVALAALVVLATAGRAALLRHVRTESGEAGRT